MQFLLSMIGEEPDFTQVTPEMMQSIFDAMDRFNHELDDAGAYVAAGGLLPGSSAKTVSFPPFGESVVSDGPFAETKEQLAGFWIIEATDIDAAVAWARKAPVQGAVIEVRPFGAPIEHKPGESGVSAEQLLEAVRDGSPARS